MKVLIFGLPGTGKTTLAKPFAELINGVHLNADDIRKRYDDWDFTSSGRIRQAQRMRHLADGVELAGKIAVADFICPTHVTRDVYDADFTIWMDTTKGSLYKDTLKMFEPPKNTDVDYHVSQWFDDTHAQLAEVVKNWTMKKNRRNHEIK